MKIGLIMMELLKNDYAPVSAKVKVYDKTYKRKNKNGKETTVKTVQNSITLPKEIPFKHNEDVIILSQDSYDYLINISKNDNPNANKLDVLENELQSKSDLIAEYESRIEKLTSELDSKSESMENSNALIQSLTEDLRNANHTKDVLNANLNETLIEMATLEEKVNKNKDIIKILTSYYESLLNESITVTSNRLIAEVNKELANTNFIQRLRGLTITSEPNINKKEITEEAISKLNSVIQEHHLLE